MSAALCFPTPLPDETIYSLFCRYHIRSCNSSDNKTILQLFHTHRSMQTTVFSAFPLKHACHWTESFHGISTESLIQNNTAMAFYRIFKPRTNTTCFSYASDRFFMDMYNNCCTASRYCPKCAQAQWEHFGVAYWQILPQINGYEICHIHKEPILETSISHTSIRYRFFPATSVISKSSNSPEENSRLSAIRKYWKQFLQMAEDINYLFRFSYPGFLLSDRVREIIAQDRLPIHHQWADRILDDPTLWGKRCSNTLLTFTDVYEDIYTLLTDFQYLPVCLQISICREMFGSIQNVCECL